VSGVGLKKGVLNGGSDRPLARGSFGSFDAHVYYGVFQYVRSAETYSICVRKVDMVSVQTKHQCNPYCSGFLKSYSVTRLKLGFPRNWLKSNSGFHFFHR